MQGVFSNANYFDLFLMIFPARASIAGWFQFNTENMNMACYAAVWEEGGLKRRIRLGES